MTKIYQSPLRVYLALGALALWGIFSGFHLPISLFPNSSKPSIGVGISYGGMTASEFLNTYGRDLESNLRSMNVDGVEVERLRATYSSTRVHYTVDFKWGADPERALREARDIVNGLASQYPLEVRQSIGVYNSNEDNTGFLAISFYSQTRSLDELYKYLQPQLMPAVGRVRQVAELDLWNPNRREIRIELNPEKAAILQILPRDVINSLLPQLQSSSGGSLTIGLNQMNIEMSAPLRTPDDLNRAVIPTRNGQVVHLSDIAHVDFGTPATSSRSVKTSGAPSLILFATPQPGSNIKQMAEDMIKVVKDLSPYWTSDVQYKILVDPSEFIRSAVGNVIREVVLAAMLAVFVLFLFIGNIRNVVTAAIEIPLSIVLAFILMRMTGINLNLISLGGLALSAGMNVDGSVVVMENIFRHFDEHKGPLSFADRVRIIAAAVEEVRFPIIASTIASLVVFLPLAFTSALTNAILGDLALAVVFSHGFSAVVALILVPTVRLQLMSRFTERSSHSPSETLLRRIENLYSNNLAKFLEQTKLKVIVYGSIVLILAGLLWQVLPRLPRELIGKPDTDWIIVSVNTRGNSMTRQMEPITDMIEARILRKYGDQIQYTFTQTFNPNASSIMARLKDRSQMQSVWKGLEQELANTPEFQYYVFPWNPSELPIPDPPHMQISVRGPDAHDRTLVGRELMELSNQNRVFARLWSEPDVGVQEGVHLIASPEQWALLGADRSMMTPADLADLSRVATLGHRIWQMPINGEMVPINLAFPTNRIWNLQSLESLPIGVAGKLVPLKALARVELGQVPNDVYRENENDMVLISGRALKGEEASIPESQKLTQKLVDEWQKTNAKNHASVIAFEDPQKDLNEALHQLITAVALSVLLIFLTMVFQFGDVVNSLLVLVAVPLGFVGVLISLFVFRSTLSLNSVLGVILLNGIAVANSIILVDFLKRLVDQGKTPKQAALEAAKKRLRPILMTSMTTGLGMLPVALGFGEGGRILQPLGIAVVGGLSFSMLTTLFIVPALQVSYLQWRESRKSIPIYGQPDLDFKSSAEL